jgi:hypothetical protein
MLRSGRVELYLHSPIGLHGIMLNLLSTGILSFIIKINFGFVEVKTASVV